jgi:hypothetical protein
VDIIGIAQANWYCNQGATNNSGSPMQYLGPLGSGKYDLTTIYGKKIGGSSRVNGILVPAASLQSSLNRFVRNLAIWTDDPNYKIQLVGSIVGINYCGSKFIVCTKHQIKGLAAERAGILVPHNGSYLSSAGYFFLSNSDQANKDDNYDLIAYDFTDQAHTVAGLSGRFFQLSAGGALAEAEDIVAYLAYGYPSADQQYDVYDENHIGLVIRSMTCDPVETSPASPFGKCSLVAPDQFDMDGLSGGAVFASIASGGDMVVKLAGVINRAGNGILHFIKAKVVCNLLDRAIKSRT